MRAYVRACEVCGDGKGAREVCGEGRGAAASESLLSLSLGLGFRTFAHQTLFAKQRNHYALAKKLLSVGRVQRPGAVVCGQTRSGVSAEEGALAAARAATANK